jgi:hypothetical protein
MCFHTRGHLTFAGAPRQLRTSLLFASWDFIFSHTFPGLCRLLGPCKMAAMLCATSGISYATHTLTWTDSAVPPLRPSHSRLCFSTSLLLFDLNLPRRLAANALLGMVNDALLFLLPHSLSACPIPLTTLCSCCVVSLACSDDEVPILHTPPRSPLVSCDSDDEGSYFALYAS